jgi:hypothetical protein
MAESLILVEVKPTSIKQLDHFTGIESSHARTWWMGEDTLKLGTFEHSICSPSCDPIDACLALVEPSPPHPHIAHRDERALLAG